MDDGTCLSSCHVIAELTYTNAVVSPVCMYTCTCMCMSSGLLREDDAGG
jgi:hypothetical protein